ncbi:membrane protein, conserved [Thermococcus sp. 4557]|nr:membrane protein, conserved [Thermococcus sp. 4557]
MPVVDVSSEKSMGMWGAILSLVGSFVPYIGSLISLIGFVLMLLALKGISDAAGDERPFKNYLYGVIFAIGGLVVILALVFGTFALVPAGWHPSESAGIGLAILFFMLFVAMIIGAAYFQKRAWLAMYEITGTSEFKDAATWVWWGALTAIILVGLLLLLIARVFVIIAFNKMPAELGKESEPTPSEEGVIW